MKNVPKVMVCVTRQKTCERLISVGQKFINGSSGEISIVHITKVGENFLDNPDEGEALEYLFQVSKQAGADMTVLRSENVLNTLMDYAKKNKITDIVMGESLESENNSNIIRNMERLLPGININVVPT